MLRSLILPFFLILEFSNFPGMGYSEHFKLGKAKSNNIIVEEGCSSSYFFFSYQMKRTLILKQAVVKYKLCTFFQFSSAHLKALAWLLSEVFRFLPYVWFGWFLYIQLPLKKNTESSIIFSRNGILILNRKENNEAGAICFGLRVQRKKNKEIVWKVPKKHFLVCQ